MAGLPLYYRVDGGDRTYVEVGWDSAVWHLQMAIGQAMNEYADSLLLEFQGQELDNPHLHLAETGISAEAVVTVRRLGMRWSRYGMEMRPAMDHLRIQKISDSPEHPLSWAYSCPVQSGVHEWKVAFHLGTGVRDGVQIGLARPGLPAMDIEEPHITGSIGYLTTGSSRGPYRHRAKPWINASTIEIRLDMTTREVTYTLLNEISNEKGSFEQKDHEHTVPLYDGGDACLAVCLRQGMSVHITSYRAIFDPLREDADETLMHIE